MAEERTPPYLRDLVGGLLTVLIESAVVFCLLAAAAVMAVFIVWLA